MDAVWQWRAEWWVAGLIFDIYAGVDRGGGVSIGARVELGDRALGELAALPEILPCSPHHGRSTNLGDLATNVSCFFTTARAPSYACGSCGSGDADGDGSGGTLADGFAEMTTPSDGVGLAGAAAAGWAPEEHAASARASTATLIAPTVRGRSQHHRPVVTVITPGCRTHAPNMPPPPPIRR